MERVEVECRIRTFGEKLDYDGGDLVVQSHKHKGVVQLTIGNEAVLVNARDLTTAIDNSTNTG